MRESLMAWKENLGPRRVCRFRTIVNRIDMDWPLLTIVWIYQLMDSALLNSCDRLIDQSNQITPSDRQVFVELCPWCAIKLTSWSRPWSVTLATEIPRTLSLATECQVEATEWVEASNEKASNGNMWKLAGDRRLVTRRSHQFFSLRQMALLD